MTSILKHAFAADAPRAADSEAEAPNYVSGIIRDERARAVQPCDVSGPDWASDFPLPADKNDDSSASEEATPDLDALRAEWEQDFAAKAAAEREAAVAEAREAAYAEGYAAAEAEVTERLAAAHRAELDAAATDLQVLRTLWDENLDQIEPHLVGLAVDVAETVLSGTLTDPERAGTATAISAAIEELAARPPLVVTLHPVDHLRLEEAGLTDALAASHPGLRWVPDPSLDEGDWSLDADGAALRHVRDDVLHDLRVRLGLLPDPDAASA